MHEGDSKVMRLGSIIKLKVGMSCVGYWVAMVTTQKYDFQEIISILVISFLVSHVETQGGCQFDDFRKHYPMEGWNLSP